MKTALVSLTVSVVLLLALTGSASAEAAYNPCPTDPVQSWQGASEGQAISIPALAQSNGNTSYPGSIFRPADLAAFPGQRPVVVLQHGLGGNACALHWVARHLAGHGFITLIWRSPTESDPTQSFLNGVDATRSAIAFAQGPGNPYASITDPSRVGIGGHSMGSIVASFVQGDGTPGVRAIVASDNLRRYLSGDSGAAAFDCAGEPTFEVTPRVPALGFAKDETCNALPSVADPSIKQAGFQHWRSHGIPSMELVFAGYDHGDFANGATDQQRRYLAHFWLAWMRHYVEGDAASRQDILAETVDGAPLASILSTNFLSGAFLNPEVDTSDYRTYLLSDRVSPQTRKLYLKPSGTYTKRRISRSGIVFRFAASESSRFECKLDARNWRKCSSPRRFRNLSVRRHALRVRAIDGAGNVDQSPVLWRFRVIR